MPKGSILTSVCENSRRKFSWFNRRTCVHLGADQSLVYLAYMVLTFPLLPQGHHRISLVTQQWLWVTQLSLFLCRFSACLFRALTRSTFPPYRRRHHHHHYLHLHQQSTTHIKCQRADSAAVRVDIYSATRLEDLGTEVHEKVTGLWRTDRERLSDWDSLLQNKEAIKRIEVHLWDPHSLHELWDDNIIPPKGSQWTQIVPLSTRL